MQNKFIFNTVKCFLHVFIIILAISFSNIFNGCSGSEEEEIVDQREKDSILVYTNLQKSFAYYKKALEYNESGNDQKASESFESALRSIDDVSYDIIAGAGNYLWRKDYEELTKAIVQDFLITQKEISESSLVFNYAKRVPITYEKIEIVKGDREPLPDGSDIPLIRNSAVDEYIEFFSKTDRGRTFIDKCLYRSGKFFPLMRKILKFNNAPEELIYLSVQESGLNPTIVSRAGAVGLWQFMPATGYAYGLGQDEYLDDRRDFEKSTDAAARHLKDLYKTYDDWYLAFCAYNAGPGRVNSAIRKSGSRDFWSLRGYLPRETKNYVPSIIALSFVLRNPGEYGFNDIEYGNPVAFDKVNIKSSLTLQRIAELCESDIETIRELNSELTNDQLPSYDVFYQLRIPHNTYKKFTANFEKANDIDKSSGVSPEFAGTEVSQFTGSVDFAGYKVSDYEPSDVKKIGSKDNLMRVEYEYKSKDLLSAVAVFYDVRPVEIRLWNNINYGNLPNEKQKLDIFLSEEKYQRLFGIKDDGAGEDLVTEDIITKVPVTGTFEDIGKNSTENTTETGNDNTNNNSDTKENTTTTTQEPVIENNTSTTTGTVTEAVTTPVETEATEEVEEATEEVVYVETKTAPEKKNVTGKTYTVSEGDNLSGIAKEHGVSLAELKEWNDLQTDKIMVGQKLKVGSSPEKKSAKTSTHTVAEGENLTMIANEYGISLDELKDLNDLDNDKIMVGQKLAVKKTVTEKRNNVKTSGVKKTYKVKKGETLASIADANDLSVSDIMSWNNLESDKIIIGQVLKLYKQEVKQKVRKKKK